MRRWAECSYRVIPALRLATGVASIGSERPDAFVEGVNSCTTPSSCM
jgi:hypothetical protein